MNKIISQNKYYNHLRSRSTLGKLYRRWWLYPLLNSQIEGLALDVGCGIGDMLAYRENTIGVDISSHTVDYCKSIGLKAQIMKPDVLPFPDNSFQSVLLDNVLEHIENPNNLIIEIKRVLNDNGILLIGVPGILGWNNDPDHKVYYDLPLLKDVLLGFGFICKNVIYAPLCESSFLSKRMSAYCIYATFISQVNILTKA